MSNTEEEQIIGQIYDLAASPDNYDDFMLSLHQKMNAINAGDRETSATAISKHLKKAAELIDVITPWAAINNDELHQYLSMKMQAVIAVDQEGVIVDANLAARVAYDFTAGAELKHLPLSSDDLTQLLQEVQYAISEKNSSNNPTNLLRLYNTENDRSLVIKVEQHFVASKNQTLAILVTNDVGWPNHLGSLLQHLFKLTNAEIEIVRLMVEGERVEGIAKRRGSTPTTIRNQLRSILSKTDSSSQLECVRTVFGIALMHDAEEGEDVAARIQESEEVLAYPRYDQRSVIALKQGRELEYSVFGAEGGQPVLFYHDQAFGDVWFKEAVASFEQQGLQIIAPLRPGFGYTTLYNGESSEPAEYAPDIRELLDKLEVDRTAIIGMGSGLVHGLAAATLMPDRIASISIGHPLLPVLKDSDLEGFNGYNYLIPHARLHFPQSIRFLCKAGFAFVKTAGPAAFVKKVIRASPQDLQWVSRPEIMQILVEGIHVHRAQGYLGNYGDISYGKDWRPLLENCPVPVRLVIGEQDQNVQWAEARRWADSESHISLHVMPESGYLVHHQHYSAFLEWVLQDLDE